MRFLCFTLLFTALYPVALNAQEYDFQEFHNLAYLTPSETEVDSLQQLNLVIPEGIEKPPLFIWIGGGAWSYVDRHIEMDFIRMLATEGIATASIGHRQSAAIWHNPQQNKGVQHPAHINDVASAFKWLYDHAQEYGYDPDNIFIGGYSSGAQLSALLTLDKSYLNQVGLSGNEIKGLIPIAGVYEITNYHTAFASSVHRKHLAEQHVESVFGTTQKDWEMASPASHLSNLKTPILLISERNTYNYTRIFEEAIRETGFGPFEVIHVRELDHAGLWKDLSFNHQSKYRRALINFINKG